MKKLNLKTSDKKFIKNHNKNYNKNDQNTLNFQTSSLTNLKVRRNNQKVEFFDTIDVNHISNQVNNSQLINFNQS